MAARRKRKTVVCALQGGGAHGAFAWGVLDRLLEDGRIDFEALSGTSAGAMNAVVVADGWGRNGPEGAREALHAFWAKVSEAVRFEGRGMEHGRTAQLTLTCMANAETFFMALHLRILPGNLGAGIFAGNTVYDFDSAPSACPALLIRNHALTQKELEARTDYLDADAEAVAGWLEILGYGRDSVYAAESALLPLLTTASDIPLIKVQRETFTRAATLVDERRMRAQ